jgi:hypothetical protein
MAQAKKVPAKKAQATKPVKARLEETQKAATKTLHASLERLRALRTEGAESWDAQWEMVDEILSADPPLWRATYASEAEFIRKELPGETPRSVHRNMLVAVTFTPEDEKKRGISVLEEIALYLMERDDLKHPPKNIDLKRVAVMVPLPSGKGTQRFSGDVVDVDQVRAARRALKKGATKKPVSPVEKAIRTATQTSKSLKQMSIRVSGDVVSLANVPVSELALLGKALARVKVSD